MSQSEVQVIVEFQTNFPERVAPLIAAANRGDEMARQQLQALGVAIIDSFDPSPPAPVNQPDLPPARFIDLDVDRDGHLRWVARTIDPTVSDE